MCQRKDNRKIPISEILLDLAKGGIKLPRELLNNLAYILHLSGLQISPIIAERRKRGIKLAYRIIAFDKKD